MPINETPNTVTVGSICFGCQYFLTKECPYKNHTRQSALFFKGDIRGKCSYYKPVLRAENKSMRKTAEKMSDSELNVELYKVIMALSKGEQQHLYDYWIKMYKTAPEFVKDMVTDDVETTQKNLKISDNPKKDHKEKVKEHSDKFPEPFKSGE